MDERRRHQRERLPIPIIYSYFMEDTKRVDNGNKALDISCGGISFSENCSIPIGSKMVLKINLINKIITCRGIVVWNREECRDKWSIGIKFTGLSALNWEVLSAASRSVLAQA